MHMHNNASQPGQSDEAEDRGALRQCTGSTGNQQHERSDPRLDLKVLPDVQPQS